MQNLSQRDGRWASMLLGGSKLTMGRYGCTTTCISMLTDYFGKFIDPRDICRVKEYYTSDGLIIWNKLKLPMKFVYRYYSYNPKEIDNSLKAPNKAVILEVDNSHWVVALKKSIFGLLVADPWTGDKCYLHKRYKKITGSAHFIK